MAITIITQSNRHINGSCASQAGTSTTTSDAIAVAPYQTGTIQVVCANVSASTLTYELQASTDGTNFDTVSGSSTVAAAGASSKSFNMNPIPGAVMQVKVTTADVGVGSTATVRAYFNLRKESE